MSRVALKKTVVLSLLALSLSFVVSALVATATLGEPAISIQQKASSPPLPVLTASQKRSVVRLARQNADFKGLTQGKKFRLAHTYVWTNFGGVLYGGVAFFKFSKPALMKGEWIALDWNCSGKDPTSYGADPYRGAKTNVTNLSVFVDLRRNLIAAIEPNAQSRQLGLRSYPPRGLRGAPLFLSNSCKHG